MGWLPWAYCPIPAISISVISWILAPYHPGFTVEGSVHTESSLAMNASSEPKRLMSPCTSWNTDQYVIGSPLFRKATITLEDGKQFIIEARNNSPENVYIQSAELNGQPLLKNYITYGDIVRGGHLIFQMGPQPNKQRNTSKEAAPYSMSTP